MAQVISHEEIPGMNHYHPGKVSSRELGIKVTSGTTGGEPKVSIIKNPPSLDRVSHYDSHFESVIRLSSKRTSQLNRTHQLLRHSNISRILAPDLDDLTHRHFAALVEEFRPLQVISIVSLFEKWYDILRGYNQKNVFSTVTHLFLEGEMTTERQEKKFKQLAPRAEVYPDYGLSESDIFAFYDPEVAKLYPEVRLQIFQLFSTTHATIVNVDEEGVGEIVLTTPQVKEYKTGDRGKLIPKNESGREHDTLIVLGRINFDKCSCVGATFLLSEIQKVFDTLSNYVADFLVEVTEVDDGFQTRGKVFFTIVPKEKLRALKNPGEYIVRAVSEHLFVTKTKTLKNLIDEGLFLYPEVRFKEKIVQGIKKIRLRKIETV